MERNCIMHDKDFWGSLEFRISGDLANDDDNNVKYLWIDGFIPNNSQNTKNGIEVTGLVWVANAQESQEQWPFTLLVPQNMLYRTIGKNYDYTIRMDFEGHDMEIELTKTTQLGPASEVLTDPRWG